MPLQKQLVGIPFAGGLDAKTDEIHVPSGKLVDIQDARFDHQGAISKRYGYTELSTTTHSANTLTAEAILSADDSLFVYGDDTSGGGYFSYDTNSDRWSTVVNAFGGDNAIFADTETVFSLSTGSDLPLWPDVAAVGGYAIVCYISGAGGSGVARIIDLSTGSLLASRSISGVDKCRAVTFGNTLGFVVANGNTLDLEYVDITSDITSFSNVALQATLNSNGDSGAWDVYSRATEAVAIYVDTSNDLYAFKFNTGGVTSTSGAVAVNSTTFDCSVTIESSVVKAYWLTNANILAAGFNLSDLSSAYSATTVDTGLFEKVAAEHDGTGVFYEDPDTTDYWLTAIHRREVSSGGSVSGSTSSHSTGATLLTRPTTINGRVVMAANLLADLQRSTLLIEGSVNLLERYIGQFNHGIGITKSDYLASGRKILSSIESSGFDYYFLSAQQVSTLSNIDEGSYSIFLNRINASTSPQKNPGEARAGDLTYVSGPELLALTPAGVVSTNFYRSPEDITVAASTGGSIPNGTYSVKAIYVSYDNLGNRYESAPSEAQSITLSGANDGILVRLPGYFNFLGNDVDAEVYRTDDGGSIYYLDKTVEQLSALPALTTLSLSNSALVSNRTLYTTGGVLENRPAPSCFSPVYRDGRLFVATHDNKIAFTKKFVDGVGVSFCDEFRITPLNGHGRISALAAMDGRVIVFGEHGISYFDGSGPDSLGNGGFTQLRPILSPVGAIRRSPVKPSRDGIFFVSSRGIELLDRNLNVSYVGKDVEDAYSGTIVAIEDAPTENEVRFICSTGDSLVYNYLFGQWSTWGVFSGGTSIIDAKNVGGSFYVLRSTGAIAYEDSSSFDDNGTSFFPVIETAWVKTSDIQGFQRIYWFSVEVNQKSNFTMTIDVYYDYESSASESIGQGFNGTGYTQHRFKLARQKCKAIKFKFSTQSPYPSGTEEGFELAHLQLLVGVKGGINRVGVGQTG